MRHDAKKALLAVALAAGMTFGTTAFAYDKDNNPPGPAGGKGTNWENPPGPAGGPGATPDRSKRHWKEKADTNNDGTVDQTERAAAKEKWADKRQERKDKMKEKADTNQDGTVDDAERGAAKAKREEWEEKRDLNKDGKVGPAERKLARKEHRENKQ